MWARVIVKNLEATRERGSLGITIVATVLGANA
jgi:hypothetical protein